MSKFLGIRGRLLLLVLVAVVPLVGLLLISARREVDQERAGELDRARARARLVASEIDEHLKNIEALLDRLSGQVSFERGAAAKNGALLQNLAIGLPPVFVNLEVRGAGGESLGALVDGLVSASEQKYFREALARRAFAIGEPVRWKDNKLWTMTFGRPVAAPDGSVAGVVTATINLGATRFFFGGADMPAGTQISVIDKDRVVILRSERPETGIGSRRARDEITEHALATRDGSQAYVGSDRVRRIAGFSTCTRAPWLVFVRAPTAIAFATAENQFRHALWVGAAALAVTLALAWLIGSRITSPLRQLAADATALGEGGRMQKSQVKSGGEVGRLAHAFNHMLAKLDERDAELRQVNDALRRRVDELQALFDLMPVGIGIGMDATGREIRMNRTLAGMLGLPPEHNASLTAPPGEAPTSFRVRQQGRWLEAHELPIQRTLADNKILTDFEYTIVRDDGAEIEVLLNVVPLHDGQGRVRGCVATYQDLTAHRRAEQARLDLERKLLETQKLESIGVLAGGIAHDFNNILTGILGNASLASYDLPANSPVQENLNYIRDGSVRAADLCQQMLAYSGRGRFVVQKLNLNHCVEETAHLLKISIGKGVVLRFGLQPDLPPIEADVTQIRQVIMNLVINASEAIGARSGVIGIHTGLARVDRAYLGGTLLASELPEGTYVYLEVSDNGCGMTPETQAKIFEPFFTTKFSGRGLGLAAVLGIVRGHKGTLKVYSEPGRGTTFKLFFPCATGEADAAAESHRSVANWRGQGRVLVVDDEESVRAMAATMLRRLGFEPALVTDGREAVTEYGANPGRYALVLMDLTMPHLDGEQTFAELRRLNPEVRVILMSGFSEQDALGRFMGQGIASFVQKPFQFETLGNALRTALEGRK